MWALSPKYPFQPPLLAGAGGYFAPLVRAYIRRSGAPGRRRHARRREGPQERAAEPVRAPAHAGHLARRRARPRRCSGTRSATSRRAPRPTARARWCSRARRRRARAPSLPAWVRATAVRSEPTHVRRPQPGRPAGRAATAPPTSTAQAGITDPRREIDVAEIYVPFSWFEPMWLENLGFAADQRGVADDGGGHHRPRRRPAREPVGRRALDEPHRRLRHAALRRGGAPGARLRGRRTRSRARRWRWGTPTAAARSSSRCGSWAASGPSRGRERADGAEPRRPVREPRRRHPRSAPPSSRPTAGSPSPSSTRAPTASPTRSRDARRPGRRPRRPLPLQLRTSSSRRCSPRSRSARCPININYRYVEDELVFLLQNADCKALVVQRELAPRVAAAACPRPHAPRSRSSVGGAGARRRRGRVRGPPRRGLARAALRPALGRRPLHHLHGRHDRHAARRDVAPRGRVLRRPPGRQPRRRAARERPEELAPLRPRATSRR